MTDPGLQNERTSLAWRRTALSLVVAAGTMAKLTAGQWQSASLVWIVVGIPVGLALLVSASASYTERRGDHLARAPGRAVLLVASATTVLGVLSLVYVAD